MGITTLKAVKSELVQETGRPPPVIIPTASKTGILPSPQVGEQGEVLEHHAHPSPFGR